MMKILCCAACSCCTWCASLFFVIVCHFNLIRGRRFYGGFSSRFGSNVYIWYNILTTVSVAFSANKHQKLPQQDKSYLKLESLLTRQYCWRNKATRVALFVSGGITFLVICFHSHRKTNGNSKEKEIDSK